MKLDVENQRHRQSSKDHGLRTARLSHLPAYASVDSTRPKPRLDRRQKNLPDPLEHGAQ